MAKKDPLDPSTTSFAYDEMLPKWHKMSTLLSGTEGMRSAGRLYLPQHPEESSRSYQCRLETSVLTNFVEMTLESLVSRPFSAPIRMENVDEDVREILDDVDLMGNSLDRFCRNWFREAVAKGFCHVMVEFTQIPEKEGGRTAQDDLVEKPRPYLVLVPPEAVFAGTPEVVNGREVLKEVRILEQVTEQQGFAEVTFEQIRRIRPGVVTTYRKEDNRKSKSKWKVHEEREYSMGEIPMVTFYATRQGFMLAKPPLSDLADLNIRHWQGDSDQNSCLTVARFPMLAVSGATDADKMVVGPMNLLSMNDPQGRFYYVEHSGKALAAGRQDLLDLEEKMAEYGATFLKKRPGGATATARALDSAEVTSALQDMAHGFQDALMSAMWYMARWLGKETLGNFHVKTDFGLSDKAQAGLDAILRARKMRDISRAQFIQALQRYNVLSEKFPVEENDKEIEAENAVLQAEMSKLVEQVGVQDQL